MESLQHVNNGDAQYSYANNSGLQKAAMSAALPLVDEAINEQFGHADGGISKGIKIVDLGCGSGPNTVFTIFHILDTIHEVYKNQGKSLPVIQVYLNDLPDNDFNNLFKLLKSCGKKPKQCLWHGSPRSFYERLFPNKSLHFAVSCYSLHWLSQTPKGLCAQNTDNIYMARSSPPEVFQAYAKQFKSDFTMFLKLRGNEIVSGGRMVLTFIGRCCEDPASCNKNGMQWHLLSRTLLEMVDEGLVKIDDLYTFNVPIYMPCQEEVKTIIHDEGSFNLDKLKITQVRWDADRDDDGDDIIFDKYKSGKLVANCIRAFMEPMLASHFGSSILDELFERYGEKVAHHFSLGNAHNQNMVVSLSRR